ARTENAPTGTFGKVTVPAAFVKPVTVAASGPGAPVALPDAVTVTSALATTPLPDAGTTVTVTLPTPRSGTVTSTLWFADAIVAGGVRPLFGSASDRATR